MSCANIRIYKEQNKKKIFRKFGDSWLLVFTVKVSLTIKHKFQSPLVAILTNFDQILLHFYRMRSQKFRAKRTCFPPSCFGNYFIVRYWISFPTTKEQSETNIPRKRSDLLQHLSPNQISSPQIASTPRKSYYAYLKQR
jgi:hypothetical protein